MSNSAISLFSRAELEFIGKDVLSRVTAPMAQVSLNNFAGIDTDFTHNEMRNVRSGSGLRLTLNVGYPGRVGKAITDRVDSLGLDALVQAAQSAARQSRPLAEEEMVLSSFSSGAFPSNDALIYHSASIEAGEPELLGDLARGAATLTENNGLLGFGSLQLRSSSSAVMNTAGLITGSRDTFGEYSVTARTLNHKGSSWAWGGNEDFSKISVENLTERAIELGRKSDNPVAVEPGRYTVILEPAALTSFITAMVDVPTDFMGMEAADRGKTVFSSHERNKAMGNKIGQHMFDRRMRMSQNPFDPELPYSSRGQRPVEWIKDGVLSNLAYGSDYAKKRKLKEKNINSAKSVRVDFMGVPSSLEEMIAATKRGVWVNRIGAISVVDMQSLLTTGVTRDGVFLIENGKITKPIKNFRFLESPVFVLNKVEAFGKSVRASKRLVLPRIMVRDFEFTGLTEAV